MARSQSETQEKMEAVRANVQRVMDDPGWCTADGRRAMVPISLLRKLLANDPEAE